jgi:cell division protein FtsL
MSHHDDETTGRKSVSPKIIKTYMILSSLAIIFLIYCLSSVTSSLYQIQQSVSKTDSDVQSADTDAQLADTDAKQAVTDIENLPSFSQ